MKKKLLTLLTLLVVCVTGTWGQDADPTLSVGATAQTTSTFLGEYETEGITLSSSASYSSGAVQIGNTPSSYDQHYFEVLASNAPIEKVSFLISGNGSNKSIQAPVFGWATTATSNTADTYRILDAVTVTANSYAAAQWFTYDFSESDVKCLRIYRTTKYISSTDPEYIGSSTALGSGQTIKIYGVKVWLKATAPTITTQPQSASYASGQTIAALTVEATASAGELSYQWYKCDDANKTNPEEIDDETNASYTPTDAGFYFVTVTDDNGSVDSDIAQISISAPEAPTINVSGAPATSVVKGTEITLTATVTGVPTPTIQWYRCDDANKTNTAAISGETSNTYKPTTTTPGTYYFYAEATNSVSTVASAVQTITVTASNKTDLTKVLYSNSFDAFIKAPTTESNGTIKAFYMAGTDAPTIQAVTVIDGATYSVEGTTLTVTAEDGTTTAVYDITVEAVSPYNTLGSLTFDGTETWVKTGYTYTAERGWRFAKNADDGRIPEGWTRLYFFVGKASSVTLTNGGVTSERAIEVYVNGVKNTSITKVPKNSASPNSITIPCNADANNMIAIVSNQTGGDGGFTSITVTPADISVTISDAKYATFSDKVARDFSESGITVYTAKANGTTVSLTEVADGIVPANTGVVLYASAATTKSIPATTTTATLSDNEMVPNVTASTVAWEAGEGKYNYILSNETEGVGFYKATTAGATLKANRAYLSTATTASPAPFLGFEGEGTTGISNVNVNHNDNQWYDLSGRRVENPTKGVYIMNGKKVIIK